MGQKFIQTMKLILRNQKYQLMENSIPILLYFHKEESNFFKKNKFNAYELFYTII